MNRLILIGNGFDLAHNLKTSYCDFIRDYISTSINAFFTTRNNYDDPLLEIKQKFRNYRPSPFNSSNITALDDLKQLQKDDLTSVFIKSSFLSDTLTRVSEINWVDMEVDYFDQLLKCKVFDKFNFAKVKALNIEFNFLKDQLEKYLSRHQKENIIRFSKDYEKIFYQPIRENEIVTTTTQTKKPDRILLLSFNYTNTLLKYKEACAEVVPTETNFIHGEIDSSANPVIFGFGDEYNKTYQEFEDMREKELLKHIKSFNYFKTSNYHNLIRFIEAEDFQVYIMGHSLGLSDRTMLKQIFEHGRCKSIKIFYYEKDGKNDYTEKTFNISSHFTDKAMMRKKIVPFNLSFPMPQIV